jgi:DNA invertase Pin-like site-specific DNA recombinase
MRAAQYVRMSTDHQQYSIANQEAAIREYASLHGLEVVRTYSDEGRSGVSLAHRAGLQQLLNDVISRSVDFEVVLVYDVSRWGRFQDADESAHYEFLCKQGGVQVHYCAEQFPNDNSFLASLCKAMKRTMAGEYARELSVKTFAGQCRLTRLGFKMGGQAGYGLGRMLIAADGKSLGQLRPGEWKYLANQRVILTPGPEHETEVVHNIFSMYLNEGMNTREIADYLNDHGILRHTGNRWRKDNIRRILFDPKYAGCSVFGRSTKKLRSKMKTIPRDLWVVRPNSFVPVISMQDFQYAEEKRRSATRLSTDEQLLQRLREYVGKHGNISNRTMGRRDGMPSGPAYIKRFGSLWRAYELAGLTPWKHKTAEARSLRAAIDRQFREAMAISGLSFERRGRVYVLQECAPFLFDVAKALRPYASGESRWELYSRKEMRGGICVAARLSQNNLVVQDWCLLEITGRSTPRFRVRDSVVRASDSVRATPENLISLLIDRLHQY